jgi:hypothetical protein
MISQGRTLVEGSNDEAQNQQTHERRGTTKIEKFGHTAINSLNETWGKK